MAPIRIEICRFKGLSTLKCNGRQDPCYCVWHLYNYLIALLNASDISINHEFVHFDIKGKPIIPCLDLKLPRMS